MILSVNDMESCPLCAVRSDLDEVDHAGLA
jgi:hypothetical protein